MREPKWTTFEDLAATSEILMPAAQAKELP
jgi:hypothetical protein